MYKTPTGLTSLGANLKIAESCADKANDANWSTLILSALDSSHQTLVQDFVQLD